MSTLQLAPTSPADTLIAKLEQYVAELNTLGSATTTPAKTAAYDSLKAYNRRLAADIKQSMARADTQGALGELGTLRQQIAALKVQKEEAHDHAETAKARRDAVEKREQVVSYHQLFLVERPLREWSVPTLMLVSVMCVLLGMRWLYLLYYGVGTGAVSVPFLFGFGQMLQTTGSYLQGVGSPLGQGAAPAAAPASNMKLPGQGLTGQLGLV